MQLKEKMLIAALNVANAKPKVVSVKLLRSSTHTIRVQVCPWDNPVAQTPKQEKQTTGKKLLISKKVDDRPYDKQSSKPMLSLQWQWWAFFGRVARNTRLEEEDEEADDDIGFRGRIFFVSFEEEALRYFQSFWVLVRPRQSSFSEVPIEILKLGF